MKITVLDSIESAYPANHYYHGTDFNGLNGILEKKEIIVAYLWISGFYLTKDPEEAQAHGQYVLVFKDIEQDKLSTDGINDGIFHNGGLDISAISEIIITSDDRRIAKDLCSKLLDLLTKHN